MTYEQFKAELSVIDLDKYSRTHEITRWHSNNAHQVNRLNPAFGYNVNEVSRWGWSENFGVQSLRWYYSQNEWCKGAWHFEIRLENRSRKDYTLVEQDGINWSNGSASFQREEKHELTAEQRDKVVAFVKQWVAEREQEIAEKYAKGAQEPSVEDLEKECEKVANEILNGKTNKYGDKLRAKLCVGKRTCDNLSKPYTALCIESYERGDWYYIAGFVFSKDKYGINHMKYMRPLCGECTMEFNWDTFKAHVRCEVKN
jgi:hypothetical protein